MKFSIRTIAATLLTSAVAVSSAFAANFAPLAAGVPAGVKHAQEEPDNTLLFLGIGAAVVIVAVAASSGGGNHGTSASGTTQ